MALLVQILQGDDSSRWYQRLVKEKELTLDLTGGLNYFGNEFDYNGPMIMTTRTTYKPGHTADEILREMDAVIADVATMLRDEQQFTMLIDTVVVDHLLDGSRVSVAGIAAERFEVVVNFLSHPRNRRIRIVCEVPAADPTVPSLTPVYPGANFPERESYDLFGVVFDGHPDLTRILMPDDWHGHPLRKDDAAARVPVTFKGDPSPR